MKILIMGSPTSEGYKCFGINSGISGGGWVENLINFISTDDTLELFVLFYANFAKRVSYKASERATYIALPIRVKGLKSCSHEMQEDLRTVVNDVKPDVVHIIGTEREHDLRLAEIAGFDKTVFSITGLTSIYEQHYFGGIDKNAFAHLSIGDIYRRGGPINEQKQFRIYAETEKALISNAKYVMGRTTWDYACVNQINPDVQYFYCSEILNPVFLENSWDNTKCKKHRIFVSQGSYPLKGLHQMIKAYSIVLKKYPDAELYIAGANILNADTFIEKMKKTTYANYILKLLSELHIPKEKIYFTGPLSPTGMLEQYLSCNVFVLPSAIENSPNSLGEAMCLGVPCVASCVGGVQDMMRDRVDGFIYPFDEPYMLAHYVCDIFSNKDLVNQFSIAARQNARQRFNAEAVVETTIGIYRKIYDTKVK